MVDRRAGEGDRRVDADAMADRTAALNKVAENLGKQGGALSDLGVAIDYLVGLVRVALVMLAIFSMVSLVLGGIVVKQGLDASSERRRLARQTANIQQTTSEVHSAVTPGQPLYAQAQAQTAGLVAMLVVENDCRLRRALAHQPMPDPSKPCTAQTPAPVLNQGAP